MHVDQHQTSLDKIEKQRKHKKELEDKLAQKAKKYAIALNMALNTPNGRVLWEHWTQFAQIWTNDPILNPAKLIEDRGKRLFLTEAILPFLENKTLNFLEKRNNDN